jgi:excisionase family DNA binding protein
MRPLDLRTYDEAAAELRVSRSTLKRLLAAGELEVVSFGATRLIRGDELRRFVLEHSARRRPTSATRAAGVQLPVGARLTD